MISPEKDHRTSNAGALPDDVRNLRHFSQAEAQLLGSVKYCFFPSSLLQPAQSTRTEAAQLESTSRLARVPR